MHHLDSLRDVVHGLRKAPLDIIKLHRIHQIDPVPLASIIEVDTIQVLVDELILVRQRLILNRILRVIMFHLTKQKVVEWIEFFFHLLGGAAFDAHPLGEETVDSNVWDIQGLGHNGRRLHGSQKRRGLNHHARILILLQKLFKIYRRVPRLLEAERGQWRIVHVLNLDAKLIAQRVIDVVGPLTMSDEGAETMLVHAVQHQLVQAAVIAVFLHV